jgi:periplasmic divalent cation tolerance protein
MAGFIQIITTTSDKKNAERIADTLIEKELAGCVQIIGPVQSTFKWRGKLKKTKEWICFIKTKDIHFSKIENEMKKIHKYSIPELLSFKVNKGNKTYLKWLEDSVR